MRYPLLLTLAAHFRGRYYDMGEQPPVPCLLVSWPFPSLPIFSLLFFLFPDFYQPGTAHKLRRPQHSAMFFFL